MTTVNVQIDNDIYECSRAVPGARAGGLFIDAPAGRRYFLLPLGGDRWTATRVTGAWTHINPRASHRLYARLLQVARIAESKLAAHESAPKES